jgi:hypothetical protein
MPLPKERYPLTIDQKKQLDADLAFLEERIGAIAALMCASYGNESPQATRAGELADALQRLKREIARTEQKKFGAGS